MKRLMIFLTLSIYTRISRFRERSPPRYPWKASSISPASRERCWNVSHKSSQPHAPRHFNVVVSCINIKAMRRHCRCREPSSYSTIRCTTFTRKLQEEGRRLVPLQKYRGTFSCTTTALIEIAITKRSIYRHFPSAWFCVSSLAVSGSEWKNF